jgi:uncharacterized protein (DUF1697 family)
VATYVAFLRGINLGKSRRVKNEALRDALESLGFEDVATFRASGNVVFESDAAGDQTERVEAGLARELGIDVVAFLRSAREVVAIAGHEPFEPQVVNASTGRLQVALLPGKPSAAAGKAALALAGEEDRLAIRGRELYWLPKARMSDSELDLKALESLVGPWTMRTKGTIDAIAEKHLGRGEPH